MNGLLRLSAEQSVIVGRNMSVLRKRAGWTLAELGKRLGKDSSSVYRMEKGERRIAYPDAALLADIFQIPPMDLLMQCHNCQGSPPSGFACLACGSKDGNPPPVAAEEVSVPLEFPWPCLPVESVSPAVAPGEVSVPAQFPGPYLTVDEVAKVLRVSRPKVIGLARKGELGDVAGVGARTLRIPESGVNAFLRNHSSQKGASENDGAGRRG